MTKTKKGNISYIIHSIITLSIMIGFGMLPPFDPITPFGMDVLGIFIGLIYGWSTVGTIWPSLAGIVLMGFTEGNTMVGTIQQAMGNDVTWQLLLIMIMLVPVEREGVSNHISKFFLRLKIVKGRPWVFTIVFLFATYILSASTSGTATILLMWAILYSILSSVGYKAGDRYTSLMVFGVVYASVLGFACFPFKGPALAILRSYTAASQNVIENASYMAVVIPITVVMLAGFVLMMRLVFRPDLTNLKNVDLDAYFKEHNLYAMSARQKALLGILILSVFMMFVPSVLPKTWYVTQLLNHLGSAGAMVVIITIMIAVKVDNKPLLNFREAAGGVQWGIVFLVMGAVYVAGVLCTEATGVTNFFYDFMYPLLGGRNLATFSLLGVICGLILTQFGNNAAMGVVLMPIIHSFTMTGDFNPAIPVTLITASVFVALLTPIASPHAALLHGNKEWISTKDVYTYAVAMTFWTILIIFALGTPLGLVIFGN